MYFEDVYWSASLKKNGFLIDRSQDVVISHAGGKTTRKDSLYTSYYYQRNRIVVSVRLLEGVSQKINAFIRINFSIVWLLFKQLKLKKWDRSLLLVQAMKDAVKMLVKDV